MGTVNYFNISTPFVWNQSDGPMPITVQAMYDHATPQGDYFGSVVMSMMGAGRVIALYNSGLAPMPTLETGLFNQGNWSGYVNIRKGPDGIYMLGLACVDPRTSIGGNSLPFHWVEGGTPAPIPPTPTPIPPTPTPGPGSHSITLVLDGRTYTGTVVG